MDGLKISEAARATGFTLSALRFYENAGVEVPERTPTGYRTYDADQLESLRFVARGKQLGLSLEDITELLELLDEEECGPVQTRIRHLVGERIGQAREQIDELEAFTSQLQTATARLGVHTPDGACDDDCGCRSESHPLSVTAPERLIPLTRSTNPDIACSLQPDSVGKRIRDWDRVLSSATGRKPIRGGMRVVFDRDVEVAALAELAAAEQVCCSFFRFDIGIGVDGVTLDVTGPADSQQVITAVFGAAA